LLPFRVTPVTMAMPLAKTQHQPYGAFISVLKGADITLKAKTLIRTPRSIVKILVLLKLAAHFRYIGDVLKMISRGFKSCVGTITMSLQQLL
jgi:hypothetical protein